MKLPVAVALTAILAAACSSAASDPAPVPVVAIAPTWTDAPKTLDLREGLEQSVPVTITARDRSAVKVEVAAPEGVDARLEGDRLIIRADYNLGDLEPITVTLDDGQQTVASIAVKVKHLEWLRRKEWPSSEKTAPPAREHGVFFLDADSRAAYLFQGSGFNPQWQPLADSWKFDVGAASWSPWTPTGDVPAEAIAAGRVAQVRGQAVAYFAGGYRGFKETEKDQSDLFRVDTTTGTFSKLEQSGTPPARQLHVFAHDGAGDRLVVFGGFGGEGSSILGDTWIAKLDGAKATWSKLAAPGGGGSGAAPSGRYGAFSGFDSQLRRLVVWSGGQVPTSQANMVNAASDAWALDLSSGAAAPKWTKLATAGTTPRGRRNGCSMYDPIGHRLFVFGGTPDGTNTEKGLFVLDATPGREKWTKLARSNEPPGRSSGMGFVDADGNAYCGFGNDDLAYTDMNTLGYPR